MQEQSLCSLEPVEGAEVGVVRPEDLSDLSPAVTGLAIFIRKSVYAVGGVIGVFMSSCLMKSTKPEMGVFAERADNSEGKVEVIGVCNCGSLGLVEGILCPDQNNECPWIEGVTLDHKEPASCDDGRKTVKDQKVS